MLTLSTIAALFLCWFLAHKKPLIGLLASSIIFLPFFWVGLLFEEDVLVFLSPAIFLVSFVHVAFFRQTEDYSAVQNAARRVLYALLGMCVLFVLGFLFGPWTLLGVLVFVSWVIGMILYGATSRRSIAFCVLSTLGASVRQNLPLPMALDSAAQGRNDYEGFIYRQIKRWLVQGHRLTDALKLGFSECPAHAVRLLQAAEQVNQLPQGFQAVEKNIMIRARQKESLTPIHPLYPVVMLIIILFVTNWLLVFVIPQFQSIITEFMGVDLPRTTQWLLAFRQDWTDESLLVLALVVGIIGFLLVCRRTSESSKFRQRTLSVLYDWVVWHIPGLHWFVRSFGLVQLTEALHLSLRAGCPVDQAVEQCLHLDLNHCFHKRIRKWHTKITRGESIAESARQCGLGRSLAWAFDEQINRGNTLNVLHMLETYYYNLLAYHAHLARLILAPCVVLCLAAIVAFIALAIYTPTTTIIHHLVEICP